KVIVYTRAWNEDTLKYEYYAIDHDGKLVRCYESGNTIEWTGSVINTMLWQFTEYTNADGTPNFYYELYNEYAGKYLAPQVTDGQIVSDDTIGINMNGRRNGRYYSDIIAWDDENYSFAGLKVENGQIVSCPKNEAMDFYFAVMDDIPVDDTLETVKTVDHTQYGITMKIKDFDTRDEMSDFLGNDDGGIGTVLHQGLLSSNLGDDGYPTAKMGSLGNLFAQSQEVNHLFVQSTYNATGYYTYDSSQNFASLKGQTGGDFTVYKELASYDSVGTRNTLKHGQFFPFNDIEAGTFASINGKNLYSTTAQLLPDSDPRKYENLYLIKNVDCYFGVELEASFTQTPDGLDDWGHDIIFEFTGDDDFWLYVDNELVIDLGGIHSAVPGSVNFRTGQVNVNGEWTTLRALFEKNYRSRNPRASDEEVERYLAQYFDEGSTIFRDYTTHTMRIFYMERGAGASNLYMHFNLASVKPGTVELTKELAGVDDSESVLAEFAYQIKYKKKDGTEEYLKNAVSDSSDTKDYVFYKDSEVPVTYKPSKTIGGVNYNDVFILKPDETAVINFPTFGLDEEEIDSYEIIECGVNDEVYSSVKANGAVLPGEAVPGAQGRKDYSIDYNSTKDRPRVVYENTVDPEALRDLTFTKKLFDADGVTPIHDDDTIFNFRLYLSTESDPELAPASEHTYHVKDPEGYYCRWDKSSQSFVSLGKRDYSELTKQEKAAASFDTGPYGTISKIPVDYTVEVRQILAGTRFKVQERPGEIPDGYSFQKYIYNGEESGSSAAEGVTDTIVTGTDPHVDICNLKGYGLRMNKEWTDKDYMFDRDTTYFAVYIQDGDDLTIVPGTLMELPYGTDTLYWYWLTLPVSGTAFEDYVAEEVRITSGTPVFDDEGKITNESSLTIVPISEGGELKLNGTQKGESGKAEFTYTVSYERGTVSSNTNVRVDTVTNDRPGILLKKQQWNGEPLAGADFTLTDDAGTEIGEFTSDEDGIISTAFLGEGKDYTLTETGTPQGWHSMEVPMTISTESTDEGVVVNVSGPDSQYYSVTQAHGTDPATVIIKNRPYTFEAVKKDGDTGKLLKNVHFELHKQVTVGGIISFDLTPLTGYTDLVTDENGIIPKIDETLPPGTYQLREKATPAGYKTLPHYIEFTVTKTGAVMLYRPYSEDFVTLDAVLESGGTIDYELDIFNYIDAEVTLYKMDENGDPLKGSKFQLCKYKTSWEVVPEYSSIDMTAVTQKTLTGLSAGRYRLEEMQAPDGYVVMTKYIYFNIDQGGHATLTDEAGTGNNSNENASINNANGITVQNTPGVELPDSGGPGTTWIYMIGGFLTAACGVAIAARRKSKGAL
ncbi:MAG: fibro-slime domain-containing protein, partial [Firmicutes bacterium]|nr:fibro-slime domain-containing protein [Bacillota bacterium]